MKSRLVSTIREVRLGQEAKQVRLKLIRSNRLCGTDICCNPEQTFVAYSVLCFGPSFERRRPSQHKLESLFACDCSRGVTRGVPKPPVLCIVIGVARISKCSRSRSAPRFSLTHSDGHPNGNEHVGWAGAPAA